MGGPGSGGARVRSGPPRDPGAIRRNRPSDRSGFVHLPPAGREGEPPAWPLSRPTKFEREMWAAEWTRPQAVMWEAMGLAMQVAMYVRTMRYATTLPKAAATHMKTAKSLMDDLGLTVGGLAKNRWIIAPPAAPAAPRRQSGSSAKDRLAVLNGGRDVRAS